MSNFSGVYAVWVSLSGILAAFGILIFGGPLNRFFKAAVWGVLLVAVVVAGYNIFA